ncbi:MAG: GT4 family glycosyltransferase PelF [Candidatus Methylomirabilis oxyfera]|nr:GT4 family glycosyltransferase PelF [Candidatus Methylomirabilis oxyfera]
MDSTARICRIIGRLNIGGPAIHAILLAEGLRSRGYETVLVSGQEGPQEGSLRDRAVRKGVAPLFLPELGREVRPGRDLLALYKLVRLLRQQQPEIVHTHTAKAGALGRIAAKIAGIPIVVHTFHGHVMHGYFSHRVTRFFLAIERCLAMASTRILTVSEGLRDELLRLGIGRPDTIEVMPLGLELDGLLRSDVRRGEFRRRLGISPEVPLVGIIARLVPIKDLTTFLEAASGLHRSRPDVRFLIVGDGELRPQLEQQAVAFGLHHCVDFLGWQRELEPIYADLNLVALSSLNEGTPVSLIEAMAAGLPVVATRVGGVSDLVEHGKTGLLVPPKNPAALSEAMNALLGDPDRGRQMGRLAREAVYPKYSDAALIDRMDRLYSSMIHASLPARRSARQELHG